MEKIFIIKMIRRRYLYENKNWIYDSSVTCTVYILLDLEFLKRFDKFGYTEEQTLIFITLQTRSYFYKLYLLSSANLGILLYFITVKLE